ncbi:CTP-dependent riboflavin kinase [Candidatus Micrarchaeota archaeon]|nr:CTP-dependent riboflavin kinase [Candidatus Micrarchaeota archaeon]MBI5176806.1 CTP-dependent riboflavin kinase [Candidatus Micrarchaeota archaeon]
MKPSKLDLILALAQRGAAEGSVAGTTVQLAGELGVSQQTASRWVAELRKEGFVEKTSSGFRLSKSAVEKLSKFSSALSSGANGRTVIEGEVAEGVHDGAYYLSIPHYRNSIRKLLGFVPYAGTLNLKLLGDADVEARKKLEASPGLAIPEKKEGKRFYGAVKCFPATLSKGRIMAAVIMPVKTHHPKEVLEVIAPVYLRGAMKLRNGSAVPVTLEK